VTKTLLARNLAPIPTYLVGQKTQLGQMFFN